MTDKLKRTILGAVIAIALAIAVSYGLISQQTADNLQTKANQAIAEDQAPSPSGSQQPSPSGSAPPPSGPQTPAPTGPGASAPTPTPRQ